MKNKNTDFKTDIIGNLAVKLVIGISKIQMRKANVVFHFPKSEIREKPIVLISDHSSYNNFKYSAFGFSKTNSFVSVIGSVHAREPKLGFILKHLGHVYTKMFVIDLQATIKMLKAAKAGYSIFLFPEGTASNCGLTHPIRKNLGGVLKKMGLDVVVASTTGAHLIEPKYCKDLRQGPFSVDYYHVFTPEQLKEAEPDEVFERVMEKLEYNDYLWNGKRKHKYTGKLPNATGLEKVLYHCPRCGKDGFIYSQGNKLICKACGNTITVDETYAIAPDSAEDVLPYERIDQWYVDQRLLLRKEIKENKDFEMHMSVELNELSSGKEKVIFTKAGEGIITINRSGLEYKGTRGEKEENFLIPIASFYGLGNQDNRYLYTYQGNETVAFDPGEEGAVLITKACAAAEELHALEDPGWDEAIARVFTIN